MKTTLIKKLLKFIIPLSTIPIVIMLIFYHSYLMHFIKTESIELTTNTITQLNTIIQKRLDNQSDLSGSLIKQDKNDLYPSVVIIDKYLNIIADVKKDNLGKVYTEHSKKLKQYIKESLENKTFNIFFDNEIYLVIKPLHNTDHEIVAFIIGNYENIFNKKTAIINQAFLYIVFIMILVTFMSIIFTIIFSYNLTHPISLLIDGTKHISKGDLSYRIDISSNDEIGILVTSFNNMIQKQKLMHDEIINLNNSLELKVKEEVEKNREKDKQLIHQSRLAQMGEMISMIAHQWRQPLSAISATSASIELKARKNKLDSDTAQQKARDISNFSQHLSKTIDDFRDFFKPNKEKRETTYDEVMHSTLSIIEVSLTNKNIQLLQELNCQEPFSTYPNEVKQVVLNLIKNAEEALLEKRVEDPTIKIVTYKEEEKYIFEISDNAGGIPEDIIEKIFDPYFSTKKEKDGTGLGLYMSKMIIEEHCGGTLSVANDEHGAVFSISLQNREGYENV